jgi:hypothetical protein
MLPREMVDTELRREMIELMIDYDKTGRDIWEQFGRQPQP